MPSLNRAIEDVRWLSEYVAKYPTLQGVFLWNLGGGSQWAGLPNKLQKLIKPITEYALKTRFPDPPKQPEPVPPSTPPTSPIPPMPRTEPTPEPRSEPTTPTPESGRGKPRVQFERVYILLPPQAGREWLVAVADSTWEKYGYTMGRSPDDAGLGDLDNKTVVAINPEAWGQGEEGQGLKGFFAKYYPGVKYVTVEASSPDDLRQILSASVS
jgi:hypothetical protein